MKLQGLILCALALLGTTLAYKSYAGYQVFRTLPLTESSIKHLAPLYFNPDFDFWSRPRVGSPVEIMASSEQVVILRNTLARLGLQPTVLIPDVGVTIENERAENEAIKRHRQLTGRAPAFDHFMTFDEIQAYLDEVVAAFPNIVTSIIIGTSTEGRPLRVLKISNGPGKTGIWFDAAVHAREWAGPPTVLYAINELTENLVANQAMLDKNDFYFLPVANPDGYDYTWTNDRMWRKTRSPNSGSNCIGTDPNRNYDYAWGLAGDGPCSETFPGSAPFSEPETKAVADFLTSTTSITFYVAVHSYGQYLLYPWGDTSALPPTDAELRQVGTAATDALTAVYETRYTVGTTYNVLYSAYGLAEDWAYAAAGIPLSYTIELPSGGLTGFNPPPSSIPRVVAETWEAYKVFAENIPDSRFLKRQPRN